MKKSTLALSVAAALGGLGFATSALAIQAVTQPTTIAAVADTSYAAAATAATVLERNADGIGHQLIIPYFTTQGDNATLIEITNHDLIRGKLVKVRFRGAANSDDLYDFTLALSPGDVWTAAVSKDAATGLAKLVSTDASCVVPASAKSGNFSTARVDQTKTGDALAAETREGYVEIINMADIPKSYTGLGGGVLGFATDTLYNAASAAAKAATLYGTVKHANNVAACDAAVLESALGADVANDGAALAKGMTGPTGQLSADWVIINQNNTAAWSGAATALQARVAAGGANGVASVVFWPQKFGTPTPTTGYEKDALGAATGRFTADPLLLDGVAAGGALPVVAPQWYDLPDLSTAYVELNAATSAAALTRVTNQLAVATLAHQIVTTSDIGAVTDVVFSQPSRRYHVAMNYKAAAAADNNVTTTGALAAAVYQPFAGAVYTPANTDPVNRQVCVVSVNAPGVQGVFNREETSPTVGSTSFVISPNVPSAATVLQLCGETSVVSINQGGITAPSSALTGSVARSDVTFTAGYEAGWATWTLPNLPVLGNTFIRARNGSVNYGFGWPVKVTR